MVFLELRRLYRELMVWGFAGFRLVSGVGFRVGYKCVMVRAA